MTRLSRALHRRFAFANVAAAKAREGAGQLGNLLALGAVLIGWAMVRTLSTFPYAPLHSGQNGAKRLTFPAPASPGPQNFLHVPLTIGLPVQTSDVAILTTEMRRLVLGRAVPAFCYNTVTLALAVNVAVSLAC